MTTAIRRSIAAIAIVALVAIMELLGAATAAAQCRTYMITNNTRCVLTLTLYNANGATASFQIPTAGATIALPRGFGAPVGIISNAGTRIPFNSLGGCTPCTAIPTPTHDVGCCATVCPDPSGTTDCALVINSCAARCTP